MDKIDKLRNYLEWLITPENEEEAIEFKRLSLVDDYIDVISKIETMSEKELIEEINIQLKPYGLEINEV